MASGASEALDRQILFGELLRSLRVQKDVSQDELAAAWGVSVHTVESVESGRRHTPFRNDIFTVASLLSLSRIEVNGLLNYAGLINLLPEEAATLGILYPFITMSFDFPVATATACEQYLLYFAEFLQNLGIESTTDISHEAGKTLFSVTPKDENQALEQIYQALNVYLQLPVQYDKGNLIVAPDSMPAQQLMIEIQTLRAKCELQELAARTQAMVMRSQEQAIQAQEVTIKTLQTYRSGAVLIESLQHISPPPPAEETMELLDGAFSIGETEIFSGIKIRLPKIVRYLLRKRKASNDGDSEDDTE